MKNLCLRIFLVILVAPLCARASNSVVNLSHYDLMRPDFAQMKREGIVGIIHEATFPRLERDAKYAERQRAAVAEDLLWGAYHYANSDNPVRQADHFLEVVRNSWRQAGPGNRPEHVLLVLDFEKNGHYPGGTMRVDQAVAFIERIHERTGVYPGFYGSEFRLRQVLGSPKVTAAQKRVLGQCWLWVANYHFQPQSILPFGRWKMWQYTGDGVCDLPRGEFPKAVANIRNAERNVFAGTPVNLREFWRDNGWRPGGE
ncbi:MAG: glycoside hydrolase family 25 protein [Chthoniobacterales bacterium]